MHPTSFHECQRSWGTLMDDQPHHLQAPAHTPLTRRMVEQLLGPLIIKRHLPRSSGGASLVVSARVGGLKYLFRRSSHWDPQLLRIAELLVHSGSSVWDVGANVGLFSCAAAFGAGRAGDVLAIEADLDAVTLLNRTRHQQPAGCARITVVPVAISSQGGFVQFDISRRARASNAIHGFGTTQTGGVRESRTLPSVTLDSLLDSFRAPDVLKIDVEGAELEVLHGARHIVEKVRPAVYCEVQRDTFPEARVVFAGAGYRLLDGDHFDGGTEGPAASTATDNLLAIPEEKLGRFVVHRD